MLLLLSCFYFQSNAQRVDHQDSVVGRDFWLTLLHNRTAGHDASYRIVVMPSFHKPASGLLWVQVPQENYTTFFEGNNGFGALVGVNRLTENRQTGDVDNPFMGLNEGKDGMAVHITSDFDVVVYLHNYYDSLENDHGDVAQILPTNMLGTQYYVMSHNEIPTHFYSEAAIVSTADNTFIDIIPTADTRSIKKGEKFTIQLDEGERYQIQSQSDLTGTYIGLNQTLNKECNPFAVFAGSLVSTVGDRTIPGHMSKQMLPLSMWGKSYSLVPFGDKRNEYLTKILAFENNTEVTINGVKQSRILGYGEYLSVEYDREMRIESNKPLQVVQFYKGAADSGASSKQDPFMLMATADEHLGYYDKAFEPNLIFDLEKEVPNVPASQRVPLPHRSVFFKTEDRGRVTYDGSNFDRGIREFPPDRSWSYSNFQLNSDEDSLREVEAEGVLVNAFTYSNNPEHVNAGFRGAINFGRLDTLMIEAEPFINEETHLVCVSEPIVFRPNFHGIEGYNPPYDTFSWDFDDGTVVSGDTVTHEFSEPGEYVVRLRGSKNSGPCFYTEVTTLTIVVADTEIKDVIGPASVCPNIEGVEYTAVGDDGNEYRWSISGGTILSSSGRNVTVDWGDTNPSAYLEVIADNIYGCEPDTLIYNVQINEILIPEIPEGPQEICFGDFDQTYQVPISPGTIYDWVIENGTIMSGQGSNEIEVRWSAPGLGRLSYTQTSTTQTNLCIGQSPYLDVAIHTEIVVDPQLSNVSCFGGSDGHILLQISGGKGPYEVVWSDSTSGVERSDLLPGIYEATVTDDAGCVKTQQVEITEPEELTATLEVNDVTCHESQNGTAELTILGGTEPYRVYWDGSTEDTGPIKTNIDAGSYSVRIRDNLDCELILNFEITQPEKLSAITIDTPTCSGESTGTILVEASGGTRPYLYRWNTSPPQDSQLINGLPAGKYSVTVTDANGCMFTFDDEEISEKYPRIQMPNAFSPNGDGINDSLLAVSDCSADFQMKVFSQWGEIIFYSDDITQGWDGRFKGEEVPAGSYAYVISYAGEVNDLPFQEVVKGTVSVFR